MSSGADLQDLLPSIGGTWPHASPTLGAAHNIPATHADAHVPGHAGPPHEGLEGVEAALSRIEREVKKRQHVQFSVAFALGVAVMVVSGQINWAEPGRKGVEALQCSSVPDPAREEHTGVLVEVDGATAEEAKHAARALERNLHAAGNEKLKFYPTCHTLSDKERRGWLRKPNAYAIIQIQLASGMPKGRMLGRSNSDYSPLEFYDGLAASKIAGDFVSFARSQSASDLAEIRKRLFSDPDLAKISTEGMPYSRSFLVTLRSIPTLTKDCTLLLQYGLGELLTKVHDKGQKALEEFKTSCSAAPNKDLLLANYGLGSVHKKLAEHVTGESQSIETRRSVRFFASSAGRPDDKTTRDFFVASTSNIVAQVGGNAGQFSADELATFFEMGDRARKPGVLPPGLSPKFLPDLGDVERLDSLAKKARWWERERENAANFERAEYQARIEEKKLKSQRATTELRRKAERTKGRQHAKGKHLANRSFRHKQSIHTPARITATGVYSCPNRYRYVNGRCFM